MSDRPAIPELVKRQVRQECYFGCVICGMPIFDYDHIKEWSEVKEHTVPNIALLCQNHHSQKTTGKLSAERVREARINPANRHRSLSKSPLELVASRHISVRLGSNEVACDFADDGEGRVSVVWINGIDYFSIHNESGYLSVSLRFNDENGFPILEVDKGEIRTSTSVWDYTYIGTRLRIMQGPRQLMLDVVLSNELVHVLSGAFVDPNGEAVVVSNSSVFVLVEKQLRSTMISSRGMASSGRGIIGVLNNSLPLLNTRPYFCWFVSN